MEETSAIQALAALAHSVRLQVFRALVVAGPEGATPGALAEQLGVGATAMSFHLKELASAQLITQQRDGRFLIYRAAFAQMNTLLGYLMANCCAGTGCAPVRLRPAAKARKPPTAATTATRPTPPTTPPPTASARKTAVNTKLGRTAVTLGRRK